SILLAAATALSILLTGITGYQENEAGGSPGFDISLPESVCPGETAEAGIFIVCNPGVITFRPRVYYDENALELVDVEDTGLLEGFTPPAPNKTSPYILRWADSLANEDNTSNGRIAALTFKIKDGALPGSYEITVELIEARNAAGKKVAFGSATGYLTVAKRLIGDADRDGELSDWDAILFERYLAGWNLTDICLGALDVDGDGELSDWDAMLLCRYLAGWRVEQFEEQEEPSPEPTEEPTEEPEVPLADGAGYAGSVYPRPESITVSGRLSDMADGSLLTPSDRSFDGIFARFGFDVGEGGLPVEISLDESFGEEQYALVTAKDGVSVTASGSRGVYMAVSTLKQLCIDGRIAAATVYDRPEIPLRGVIEGFYGTAWTHSFRLELLDLMGLYKLNVYIYAPKDDLKHRTLWRSAYTSSELRRMKELVDRANENCVRFTYAISPGNDIDLGAGYAADFKKLTDKCESVYNIGVRDFAILLDDIPTADAQGHAKLVNDFQNEFIKTHEGCSDLVMITTEYCDAYVTEYSSEIAPLIQPEIRVMWTGQSVIPASITERTLKKGTDLYGRKLYIWWNYPVNDVMPDNLFLGPCQGLGKNIGQAADALVSNPMNQGYASMLPLLTISDFLWNPGQYDKENSLKEATMKLAPDCAEGLYTFADLCRADVMNGSRSTLLLSDDIRSYLRGNAEAPAMLRQKLEKAKEDLAELRAKGDRNFIKETGRWLTKAEAMIDAALSFVDFEAAADSGAKDTYVSEFDASYDIVTSSTAIVSDDVLLPFLEHAEEIINTYKSGVR
ncbi:MAG: beta-N-acetylglucosaminidase domain-containing protein, partial [Clostridia bacterium]|nr:beta-N-acetylglucosaminidase domain-containing protein [Clostridia bacterium]